MENKEQSLRTEYKDLLATLSRPDIFSDASYPTLAKRQGELESLLALFDTQRDLAKAQAQAKELSSSKDEAMVELAQSELAELETKIAQNNEALSAALTPKDPNDERDAIVEIRAAAGGDEASLFAGDLYKMYARWSESHHLKLELISESPSEVGGFKEVIFAIHGTDAYKNLKFEAGVHRVQRIPSTESNGRIHGHKTGFFGGYKPAVHEWPAALTAVPTF